MSTLTECAGCGGLKQPKSRRCPHCRRRSGRQKWLSGLLAVLGLGTVAACGDGANHYSTDAYGLPPFLDSGPNLYLGDAYGIPAFRDAGVDGGAPDAGDGGDSD